MRKLTVMVDMDDTIENLKAIWIDRLNARYGYQVDPESVIEWNIAKSYPGLTREQVYDVVLEADLYDVMEPLPGAVEALRKIQEDGHRLLIVTTTNYEIVPAKMTRFLFKYFPFIDWHDVILTHYKPLLKGDVLIDDGIHNLEGADYVKVLFSASHNRLYDAEANGMIRVDNWTEAYEVVRKLAEE